MDTGGLSPVSTMRLRGFRSSRPDVRGTPDTAGMAVLLKASFGPGVVSWLAGRLAIAHPPLEVDRFVAEGLDGFAELELMDRGRHLARVMARHLPADPRRAVAIVTASLDPLGAGGGAEVEATAALAAALGAQPHMVAFRYLPHVMFVGSVGLDAFEESMVAQYELTQRFTAEFSIRPFLVHHRDRTLEVLTTWVEDPHEDVRRLVSEGTRPRLPWAPRLPEFIADPAPVLALLERLKDDPSPFVRLSVANNLNDISRDHPELVVDVAGRWWAEGGPERQRLVRRGLRTLVKQAHPGALAVLGLAPDALEVTAARIDPAEPRIGDRVRIEVDVADMRADGPPRAVATDLAVRFARPRGAGALRVFKGGVRDLRPGETTTFTASISLAQHTTRTHHPGRHQVVAQVNGRRHPVGGFDLVAGATPELQGPPGPHGPPDPQGPPEPQGPGPPPP